MERSIIWICLISKAKESSMPRSEAEVRFSVRAMNVFAKVILALLYICDHRMRFFFLPRQCSLKIASSSLVGFRRYSYVSICDHRHAFCSRPSLLETRLICICLSCHLLSRNSVSPEFCTSTCSYSRRDTLAAAVKSVIQSCSIRAMGGTCFI
jgi:hypothetical protein